MEEQSQSEQVPKLRPEQQKEAMAATVGIDYDDAAEINQVEEDFTDYAAAYNDQEENSMENTDASDAQRFIDVALKEMNAGNYDKAIKLLNTAKNMFPNSQAEELQELIIKLRAAHQTQTTAECKFNNTTTTTNTAGPHKCFSATASSSSSKSAHIDYTQDQLDLVIKINKKCQNFYQVLNVARDATDSDIKRAYKRLALQLHPDKNRAPGAAEAFKTVGNAVSVLTDPCKRKEYDALGANSMSPKSSSGSFHSQSSYHRFTYNPSGNGFESHFSNDDISAEELFNMFFGTYPSAAHRRRRNVFESTQHRPTMDHHQQPSLAYGLILVLIFISMLTSFFTSDPVYNLQPSSKYPIRRETQHLSVPYYVKEQFQSDYQGSLGRLENSVEEDFIYTMKQNCYRERSYPEMDDLIKKLLATSINSTPTSVETTTTLLTEISATKDPKLFDKHELAKHFMELIHAEDTNVRRKAAKCVAEITKSEVQRKKFTNNDVIKAFIDCLRNLEEAPNMALPIQICRALGNICYLNEDARNIIMKLQGDEVLMNLLDIVEIADKENALQFVKVRGGLITNYLLGGEGLAKRALDLQIMQKIQKIISFSIENGMEEADEDLLLNTLPILSILTENVSDLNFDASLNIQLSRILAVSTNPDLAEVCLELLHYQAESDKVKLLLAKDGLCETIYKLLEKYKTLASTSEARALMKLACELIVLIVSGDESMKYLYSTPLLKYMEDWLDSEDLDLLTTGVMALGNFARTDSHCIDMVERKVMNKLLAVLAKHNGVSDDWRLQHGLLCTLRNLVITKSNKDAIIQAGLVETIMPMLEIQQLPVVFKLLGTLRMTVDGQEKLALELLKNKKLMELLVYWSRSTDYVGVTDESLRLMAWLVKHAYLGKIAYVLPRKGDAPAEQLAEKLPSPQTYDRSSLKEFIAHDGTIESMVNMLTSQHLVMQNEALIALCIISVMFLVPQAGGVAQNEEEANAQKEESLRLQDALIKYELGKKLDELITKSSDTMTKEIVENLQNFTNLLKTSEKLVAHMDQHNINELLKSIPILTEYCTL